MAAALGLPVKNGSINTVRPLHSSRRAACPSHRTRVDMKVFSTGKGRGSSSVPSPQLDEQQTPEDHDTHAAGNREPRVNRDGEYGTGHQPKEKRAMGTKTKTLNQDRDQDSSAIAKSP